MHRLRLSDGRGHTKEFQSPLPLMHSRLNQAFVRFYKDFNGRRAVLEVFSRFHGWQPVYDEHGYCIQISNPLQIDHAALTRALSHTLAIITKWPTAAEQREKKARALAQERALEAQIRRSHFHLVPPRPPHK